jgi:hypothetical protein
MTDDRGQKKEEASRGLSPAAIGFTLGAAAVAWMLVKLFTQGLP